MVKQTTANDEFYTWNEHEVVFDKIVSKKYLDVKVKAALIAMGATFPAVVRVVTPNKIYSLKIK